MVQVESGVLLRIVLALVLSRIGAVLNLNVVQLLNLTDCLLVDLFNINQRILIHGVNAGQRGDNKVQDTSTN